jgi:hypothetical protein
LKLTMPAGYDPHVGFDTLCFAADETVPPVLDCDVAPVTLWPPNHKMVPLTINLGEGVDIAVSSITQDEPVTSPSTGNFAPDGQTSPLAVRAERAGAPELPGDGRVYNVNFTATDTAGETCQGTLEVCVPHDQSDPTCVDSGQNYSSIP